MKRSRLLPRPIIVLCAGLLALTVLVAPLALFAGGLPMPALETAWEQAASVAPGASSPEEEVQAAWRRAQEAGAYQFATEIVQTTYPAPRLTNVGRSSRVDTLYLEGETNLPERTMQMVLWQNGGSVLNPGDGVEMRIEGDQAYGRQTGGGGQDAPWQEIDDFSGAFAPGNDLLAYLAGAKNVREVEPENSQFAIRNSQFTIFSFDVDGPAFGDYLRKQLEEELLRKGELPAGLTLDVSNEYRSVIGDG